jgi:hypothetical protein
MEAYQPDQLGDPNMPNGLMMGSTQRLSKYCHYSKERVGIPAWLLLPCSFQANVHTREA